MRPGALFLAIVVAAGCVDRFPPPTEGPAPAGLPEVALDHDHRDPALHDLTAGLELVGFLDARDLLGDERGRLSDLQFHGIRASLVVNGRAGPSAGGFFLLDASDPAHLRPVARYRAGSDDNWYTKWSSDGRYVFLTANGGTDPRSTAAAIVASLPAGAAGAAAHGIHVVDVSDLANPRLAGVYPEPVRVINLAPWTGRDGLEWLFASVLVDRPAGGLGGAPLGPLNYVSVLRFGPDVGVLWEAARWRLAGTGPGVFAHDLAVERHPTAERDLLYVAAWDDGAYVVDVTRPDAPQTVARVAPLGPADHVHTFKPHPGLVGGRHWAVAAPETFSGEPSGTYRLFDVTDPVRPTLAANWTLPPGDVVNPEPLLWSPHEFSLDRGRLYASQFHGGVWVVELGNFTPVAMWQRTQGAPARTDDWAVDVATVVAHRGLVYAVDMGSGVVALRETV